MFYSGKKSRSSLKGVGELSYTSEKIVGCYGYRKDAVFTKNNY